MTLPSASPEGGSPRRANAGILDRAQFSVLVTTVVASAIIPTIVAQRWFSPGTALEAARGRAAAAPK